MQPDDLADLSDSSEPNALRRLTREQQERLSTILDRYLISLERGQPLTPESLVRENPDLAEALESYLRSLDDLHNVAAGFGGNLSSGARDVRSGASSTSAVDGAVRSDDAPLRPFDATAYDGDATARDGDLPSDSSGSREAPIEDRRIGDFRLIRTLGQGGMGVVYEATQISLGRRVALKVLPFAAVLDQRQIARFKNEAQAAAQLNHPHIVPVYAIGVERGVHYYAMQYIDGQSLDRAIEELRGRHALEPRDGGQPSAAVVDTVIEHYSRAVTRTSTEASSAQNSKRAALCRELSVVLRLGIDAAEALHAAHESGVIHRDIKPSNLMLDAQGKIWITDFGLARVRSDHSLTKTGDVVGTQRYMSPEQAAGQTALVDPRSDVYSLAVTLYELLALQPAFGPGRDAPPSLRRLRREVPVDLETVLNKAMAGPRDDRYPTARAFAEDLRRVLDGQPTVARPPTFRDRMSKWMRRHRRVVSSAAAVSVVACLGLLVATILIAQARRQSEANFARAERNYRDAREIVDRLGTQLANRLAELPGADATRRDVLQDTLHYYRRFAEQSRDDPQLRAELASTYVKMGGLANQLGDTEESLAHYELASQAWRQVVAESPANPDLQGQLARCLCAYGRLLRLAGRPSEARERLDEAIALQQRLVQRAADSVDHRSDLAMSHVEFGVVAAECGSLDDAERSLRTAVAILEPSLTPSRASPAVRRSSDGGYTTALDHWASVLAKQGRWAKAAEIYRRSAQARADLVRREPDNDVQRRDLATVENNLGLVLHRLRDIDAAEQSFHRSLELHQTLLVRHPDDANLHSGMGGVWNNLGSLAEDRGEYAEAAEAFQAAADHQQMASRSAPEVDRFRLFLNRHLENLSRVKRKLAHNAEPVRSTHADASSSVSSPTSLR